VSDAKPLGFFFVAPLRYAPACGSSVLGLLNGPGRHDWKSCPDTSFIRWDGGRAALQRRVKTNKKNNSFLPEACAQPQAERTRTIAEKASSNLPFAKEREEWATRQRAAEDSATGQGVVTQPSGHLWRMSSLGQRNWVV
jgi:hypothetical protein